MGAIKEFYGGTFINTENAVTGITQEKIELKYYKIINTIQKRKVLKTKYGIEVVKKRTSNNIVTEEKKDIFDCIENEETADKVLEILKTNKISPINVLDVLEDLHFGDTPQNVNLQKGVCPRNVKGARNAEFIRKNKIHNEEIWYYSK